jgi:Cu+-exporting ATPase
MKVSLLDPGADVTEKDLEMEKITKKGVVGSALEWARDAWEARKRNKEEAGYVPLRDMGDN